MVKFHISMVALACRLCAMDQTVFGQQIPLKRKISPYFKADSGRIAWGVK